MSDGPKAKALGLYGAKAYGINPRCFKKKTGTDVIEQLRRVCRDRPDPAFEIYGPKTASKFEVLQRSRGAMPD